MMSGPDRLKIIDDHPIGNGLDLFRANFTSLGELTGIRFPDDLDQLSLEDAQRVIYLLLANLAFLPVAQLLPSKSGIGTVEKDLQQLIPAVTSNDVDFDDFKPLVKAALSDKLQDRLIWDLQTPWQHTTSSLVNSSEFRQDVDRILKFELGPLYVGLPNFCDTFFGRVPNLMAAAESVFRRCREGKDPIFNSEGWKGWPAEATESDVLAWFGIIIPKLVAYAEEFQLISSHQRKLLAQPRTPLSGSTGKRSMDIGFVDGDTTQEPKTDEEFRYRWSHILVPGELKSNRAADIASELWIDLATYAREVPAAQDTRRFVMGFTLCGSFMRIWEFDRIGGIASERFDINKDGGLQFVTTILGFLCMDHENLGFDPTIMTSNEERYIEVKRDGQIERIIIDQVMKRTRCITGRATTCWKAHREGDPTTPLVIKDSWQYTDRDEEGEILQHATTSGVINVARLYHYETVRIHGADDNIQDNIRIGLDITKATNYRSGRSGRSLFPPSSRSTGAHSKSRSRSTGLKRSSSEINAASPSTKRSRSTSRTKTTGVPPSNRVHRRIILRDFGRPIYKASSQGALLAALRSCIEGHESLLEAGFLHRDISINNLMINEGNKSSPPAFLIDLDLAVKAIRTDSSGAKGKTGTRAFMAIGALLGEQHSFMHDLESFFWVLVWICIHYNGPTERARVVPLYDKWNYLDTRELARNKTGLVAVERQFLRDIDESFTPYYQCLAPCVNKLRRLVFPMHSPWEREDRELYSRMRQALEDAQEELTRQPV
ncbi:hypothetical protein N7488_001698 [Penicillium malachiteum]|nr:hypothetical protein N7488_001698 [Penicillium malachiteum]